jgi:poly(ADP-ribose) glycohydrolase ARH3
MTNRVDLKSKFLGGMEGSALGDAIGEMAFWRSGEARLRSKIAQSDVLVYTDDTAMAIGLAEAITQLGRLDQQHLGDIFRANYKREPRRGYAMGPPTVFHMVEKRGMSYSEAARSLFGGRGSFGNGAAMRIVPVGLFFHDSPDLYEQARASASVTHAHPVGVDGAAVLACAIAQAVKLAPQEPFPLESFSQGLVDFARTPEIRDKMVLVRTLLAENVPSPDAARRLGRSVGPCTSPCPLPSTPFYGIPSPSRRAFSAPSCTAGIGIPWAPWPAPSQGPIWASQPSHKPGERSWRIASILRNSRLSLWR